MQIFSGEERVKGSNWSKLPECGREVDFQNRNPCTDSKKNKSQQSAHDGRTL